MMMERDIVDRVLSSKEGATALAVVEKMNTAGHECLWVGGAVRDMLLGKIPKEIDMAMSCKPEEAALLFPASDLSAAALGTLVISEKGQRFELTTFREDDEASDGRHPESVRFGTLEEDAKRRDATINALYWHPITGELKDFCEGVKDLKELLVRFIGEPAVRIRHDALRILRMIRLRAAIGGQYDPRTYTALVEGASLAGELSGTRILQELEKTLSLEYSVLALEDMMETGVMKAVLPEVSACKGVPQPIRYHQEGDVWEHLKKCVGAKTEDHGADVRLAAFLHDIGKAVTFANKERIRFDEHARASADLAENLLRRLQVGKARISKISWLIAHHMMMGSFKEMKEERKAHWYFHPWFQELLQLFWLDIAGTDPQDFSLYDSIIADYNRFLNDHPRPKKPLLSGDDIMKILNMTPGEEVGKALSLLHEAQIRKEVQSKAEAVEFLKKHAKND